ncbi:thiamine-phosphate kinase [Paenibacillus tundrae]|uniref:Thiamine-monophosphate kinase n=1 Tax=Paenibacillus tundrae TaxID=528187 RepID=A0ABT9WJL8_9BACL|nr:thiamine-phosphate kinase [Paenibacillus tundrae]MDQ0173373.1 thiamine-monophosphate kinase [Paenibacillus tundrae]
MDLQTVKDVGEKNLIKTLIKPLFNPLNDPNLSGDDCAVIKVGGTKFSICLSTDRVPADLISFKLGIIDYFELGYYLAVLNISDVLASGSTPTGLLLNFAFPNEFETNDLNEILLGVKKACDEYDCPVIGGDLSHSIELSLSATSIGIVETEKVLYRSGANSGDLIYCSDDVGLTSTAFYYFLKAKPMGHKLTEEEENILKNQFKKTKARKTLSLLLSGFMGKATAMDNTDGFSQSYLELSEINKLKMELDFRQFPIHPLSYKVAEFLEIDISEVILGGGADFQFLGTINKEIYENHKTDLDKENVSIIGICSSGSGLYLRKSSEEDSVPFKAKGWDYFNMKLAEDLEVL